jgi:hypothetical protein
MSHVKNLKTDGDKFEIEKGRKKEYLKKYKNIKQELINKYGEPTTTGETKSDDGYPHPRSVSSQTCICPHRPAFLHLHWNL